ncbi:MAG: 30S ribosomal protein S12 methylthiotransferase RimO [Candidatus Neomarinimicrobiota bacterium]|nr:MAG: 30S ribosomal protein S12 methylthiotransferase RimO [Candidatus Neomarinimicrobiota bacterium]
MSANKSFSIISLGCPKNTVDSEVLKGYLESHRMNYEQEPENADVIIINTCGFIESAREESIETILETLEMKKDDPGKKVYAIGCLTQRYPEQLRLEIPDLDGVFGVDSTDRIVNKIVPAADSCSDVERVRSLLTPGHTAFLKIAEGCDNKCSFCSIPLMRGTQRSRSIDSLLNEANYLREKGARELILIAQDLTRYGSDLSPSVNLELFLEELLSARLFPWVRLLYANPDFWNGKTNRLFNEYPELCPYLDIPIQHASPRILKRMERGSDVERMAKKLVQLRKDVPGIALRTTVMVGFPSETEEDFAMLLDFIEKIRFERLGVFTYSREEETAAYRFSDDVPEREKERRKELIMQLQWDIGREFAESKIGQTIDVIIEGKDENGYVGRSRWDAPEIDGVVRIESDRDLSIGDICSAEVFDTVDIDLTARITD